MTNYPTYKLGEICETTSGGTPNRKNDAYYGGSIPWVKSGELGKGVIFDTEEKITEEAVKESSAKIFPEGTLLIALYGATIGKLGFLGVPAATNQAVCGIFANEKIDLQFLSYYLFHKRNDLIAQGTGGAQPNISQTILKNLPIPLPPLSTQHAIVTRIETLFAELDKAVQHLRTAQQQLKTYRQAVLNHWLNNEDGKWEKKTAEECVVNENYSLAIGPFGSDLKVEDYTESGVKLVFVRDITSNFEDKKNKFVSEYKADQLKAHNVFKGDLLITKMGDPPGQTGIFPYDRGVITSDVLRMKTNDKILNKYYAMYYILSSEGGKQIKEMTQGVAQKKISLGRFKKFLFPIPSIPEQQRIVNEIESRLSQATASETYIENTLQQAEALRQSILKKAFSGELV